MRVLRIYSLNNYPVYYKAVVVIVIMLYITSLALTYLLTASLYLSTTFIQPPLTPHPLPLVTTKLISFSLCYWLYFNFSHSDRYITASAMV